MTDPTQAHVTDAGVTLESILPLYQDGLAGDEAAVLEAHRLLERLRAKHPGDPLADAYHGSIMILMARDKTKPLEKLRWSKAGLKLLDAAVRASPKDDMIRVLRGKACNKLPEKHFRRTATAIEDFAYLVDRKERNEVSFTDKEYSQLVYDLGDAYSRIGRNRDAIATLRKLDGMSIDPELRRLVTERLQSLAGKPEVEVVPQESGASSILLGIAAQATARALQTWAENQRKKEEEARRREEQRRKKRKKRRRR